MVPISARSESVNIGKLNAPGICACAYSDSLLTSKTVCVFDKSRNSFSEIRVFIDGFMLKTTVFILFENTASLNNFTR
jgi:hypothetical protein